MSDAVAEPRARLSGALFPSARGRSACWRRLCVAHASLDTRRVTLCPPRPASLPTMRGATTDDDRSRDDGRDPPPQQDSKGAAMPKQLLEPGVCFGEMALLVGYA